MPKYCEHCGAEGAANYCQECGRPQGGNKARPGVDYDAIEQEAKNAERGQGGVSRAGRAWVCPLGALGSMGAAARG